MDSLWLFFTRMVAVPLFKWYNLEHYHSGIGLMRPVVGHYRQDESVIEKRQIVLNAVFEKHPERFVKKFPTPQEVPAAVWINPPEKLLKGG